MTIKKYKAYATVSYEVVCEFELDEKEDAFAYAKDFLDGADFEEIDGSWGWNLHEVEEVVCQS